MMDTEIEPTPTLAPATQEQCFGCGADNPGGLRLRFEVIEDLSVVCLTQIEQIFGSHPGFVHGGVIATMLDEAMAKAARAHGHVTLTRQMETEYLRPVPTGKPIRVEGRLLRFEGSRNWTEACIRSESGRILAQAKGLFIEIKPRA